MIRIERKNTPKAQLAIADLQKAYKSGGLAEFVLELCALQ